MFSILVVDDEAELRRQISAILTHKGYAVDEASNGLEAARMLTQKNYALVLSDVQMPEMSGMELVKYVRERDLSTAIALITAHGNIRDAIEAIREGAFDYIEKPIEESTVIALIKKAENAFQMIQDAAFSAPVGSPEDGRQYVGSSEGMKKIFKLVERLSRVNTSVLIRGENGTGKELVARAIHFNSTRKDGPFIAVNCGAIAETLIESELFGHEKGAFTGADQRKIGKFQAAATGTIFLDEVGDTSPATQVKLLRVLQEHTFTPVGSTREVKSDVRIIAATNRDLEKMIAEGKFREDLFYRLNVMPLYLPALRDRKEDIPILVKHFIDKFNKSHAKHVRGIQAEAMEALEGFHWPGNIRELENAIEHAFVVDATDQITFFGLPEYLRKAARKSSTAVMFDTSRRPAFAAMDWDEGKEYFEREFIIQALRNNKGRINQTAEQANIPKNTLLRRIRKFNINPRDYGDDPENNSFE